MDAIHVRSIRVDQLDWYSDHLEAKQKKLWMKRRYKKKQRETKEMCNISMGGPNSFRSIVTTKTNNK